MTKLNNLIIIFGLFVLLTVFSDDAFSEVQHQRNSLSKVLWGFAKACDSELKSDGVYAEDIKVIDDSRKGYLHLSGSYPTCGCTCSVTVGAYSKGHGNYSFLKYENWSCRWSSGVSSQNNLQELLPSGFGLESFSVSKSGRELVGPTAFYLKVEVPRIGTDTLAEVAIIPFGLNMNCPGGLCYTTFESKDSSYEDWLETLKAKAKDKKIFDKIAQGQWDQVSKDDKALLDKVMGSCDVKSSVGCPTKESIQRNISYLFKVYEFYIGMKYTQITLGWDRKAGKFFIKNKMNPSAQIDFYNFIIKMPVRVPAC